MEETVLCGASAYTKKYYLDKDFEKLPTSIQEELRIMCVLFTAEIGGTIQLVYDQDGNLYVRTDYNENDFGYDEIGSGLKVKQMQREHSELFESLEMYYKVMVLGKPFDEQE